jgi:hypothetical protein
MLITSLQSMCCCKVNDKDMVPLARAADNLGRARDPLALARGGFKCLHKESTRSMAS